MSDRFSRVKLIMNNGQIASFDGDVHNPIRMEFVLGFVMVYDRHGHGNGFPSEHVSLIETAPQVNTRV